MAGPKNRKLRTTTRDRTGADEFRDYVRAYVIFMLKPMAKDLPEKVRLFLIEKVIDEGFAVCWDQKRGDASEGRSGLAKVEAVAYARCFQAAFEAVLDDEPLEEGRAKAVEAYFERASSLFREGRYPPLLQAPRPGDSVYDFVWDLERSRIQNDPRFHKCINEIVDAVVRGGGQFETPSLPEQLDAFIALVRKHLIPDLPANLDAHALEVSGKKVQARLRRRMTALLQWGSAFFGSYRVVSPSTEEKLPPSRT